MSKILALWAVPRSTSTAFEWVMRRRGDFVVHHEPFNEVYYYGEDRRTDRDAHVAARPGLSYESVWRRLREQARSAPVFIKDFAYSVEHMADEAFLSCFEHTFLIRDPAKVLPSLHDKWPDFTLEEAGFGALHRLFDNVSALQGRAPPVIDSHDLVGSPAETVAAYCDAVGVAFDPGALAWEPDSREEASWYDGGSWHGRLRSSRGIEAPAQRSYVGIDANAHLKRAYELCLPSYEALYAHRLQID